ncbi:TPA: hypothetical protein DEP26_01060 [Candidatus Uhrbacteria bacterium]|nr:hypothetical protein [Candidatus Uhrbacteria bacterium]
MGLKDQAVSVRHNCAEMIQYTPESERTRLIETGLKDQDISVRLSCAQMIQYAPESEQEALKKHLAGILKMGLKDQDIYVRDYSAQMIQYASESERTELIEMGLKDQDEYVRRNCAQMIQYAPESEQKGLKEQARVLGYEFVDPHDLALQTPLYKKTPQGFLRKQFEKTGSGTTLLGGELKERVIVRSIEPQTLMSWKEAFENREFWKKKGFEIVPVEPIVGIKPSKKGIKEVHVFTRVIPGPSVAKWEEATSLWRNEIETQKKTIIEGLAELKIEHGHLHDGNFVLYFHRTPDGKADLSKPPMVYVIDFDQAVSSPSK